MGSSKNERTPLLKDFRDDEQPGPSRANISEVRKRNSIPEALRNNRLQLQPRGGRWGFGEDLINDGTGRYMSFHEWVENENKEYYNQLRELRRREMEPPASDEDGEWGRRCCKFIFNWYSMLTLSIAVAFVTLPFYYTWDNFIYHATHYGQRTYTGAVVSTVLTQLVILGITWILVISAIKLLKGCWEGLSRKFKDLFGSRRSSVASVDPEGQWKDRQKEPFNNNEMIV